MYHRETLETVSIVSLPPFLPPTPASIMGWLDLASRKKRRKLKKKQKKHGPLAWAKNPCESPDEICLSPKKKVRKKKGVQAFLVAKKVKKGAKPVTATQRSASLR